MLKKCFKCGEEKDIEMFYRHKAMADGRLGKCKECAKKDVTEHRNKNIERVRAYDRERGKLPHRILASKLHTKWFREHNPEKYAAQILLGNAVRAGKLKRPNKCSRCGRKTKIMGHHIDYFKPLDVIWVCQPCHKVLHKVKP